MAQPAPRVTPAVICLGPSGEAVARGVATALGAALHGRAGRITDADAVFGNAAEHLRALFAAGIPIVGVCAAGILIRAVAPLLADKRAEPPVIAVAEDGSAVVPLLGGHRGANALARRIAEALGGTAAVTTAGDLALGIALDEPPPGWRLANPEDAKPAMTALLVGAGAVIEGDLPWLGDLPPSPTLPHEGGGGSRRPSALSIVDEGGGGDRRPSSVLLRWKGGAGSGGAPSSLVGESRGGGSAQRPGDAPAAQVTLTATTAPLEGGPRHLVYHPQLFALGVGCARSCPEDELAALAEAALAEAGISPGAIAAVLSLDLKADEPAVNALARRLGLPLRLFDAATLETETPRLATPSATVFAEVGCHGVAEAAALAGAGPHAELVLPKRKSASATVAVARAPAPLAELPGRPRGRLALVGIGPGQADWRTPEASRLIAEADELVGYALYLDLLGPLAVGKPRRDFPLGTEEERCRYALERAGEGLNVALVSSGDAGVYAMGALVFELLDRPPERGGVSACARRAEIVTAPGVSALQAAAARAGAPLGHDFCAISLSDLLTPREDILRRIRAAAQGDFVIAFYNPVSARRRTLLTEARDILLGYRPADTPVLLAANLGRRQERLAYRPLAALDPDEVDMLTVILVGSSKSRLVALGDGRRMYTPRGYARHLDRQTEAKKT